jgi:hypothetical protein
MAGCVLALRVEGAIRKIWEVYKEFVRRANIVFSRWRRVWPIWATGLIRGLRKMRCSRPTGVG